MVGRVSRSTASVVVTLFAAAQQRTLQSAAIHTTARTKVKEAGQQLQSIAAWPLHRHDDAQCSSVCQTPNSSPTKQRCLGSHDAALGLDDETLLDPGPSRRQRARESPSTVLLTEAEHLLNSSPSALWHLSLTTRLVAAGRKEAGLGRAQKSLKDVFSFLSPERSRIARLAVSRVLARLSIPRDVWLHFVNVLGHCDSWDDCVLEMKTAADLPTKSLESKRFTDTLREERKDFPNGAHIWPSFVLLRAIKLIRNAGEAEEATKLLDAHLDGMPVSHAVSCYTYLDEKVHLLLTASHLGTPTTDLALRLAGRILRMPDHIVVKKKLPLANASGALEAVTSLLIAHHVRLKKTKNVGNQRHTIRMVEWVESEDRLLVELADRSIAAEKSAIAERLQMLGSRLRMRILNIVPRGVDRDTPDADLKPWDETDWTRLNSSEALSNSKMAYDVVKWICDSNHSGKGGELALERAVNAAGRDKHRGLSANLAHLIEEQVSKGNMDESALRSKTLLKAFADSDQKNDAWNVFRAMVQNGELQQQRGEYGAGVASPALDRFSSSFRTIIGMAARDPTAPLDMVLELAGFEGDSLRLPDEGPNTKLYGILLGNLPKRRSEEGYEATRRVWDFMRLNQIRPDSICVGAYCQFLIRTGHYDEGIEVLHQRVSKTRPIRADGRLSRDRRLVQSVLLALADMGQAKRVYEIFHQLPTRFCAHLHARHLECLLQAARSISEDAQRLGLRRRTHRALTFFLARQSDEERSQSERAREQEDWDGVPAAERARAIFRRLLFHQHPKLLQAINPLSDDEPHDSVDGASSTVEPYQHGFAWRQERAMIKMQEWITNRFDRLRHWEKEDTAAAFESLAGQSAQQAGDVLLTFDAPLFDNYLQLLPYVERNIIETGRRTATTTNRIAWDERFLVLSWMRALHVVPMRRTLCLLCLHMDELLPPSHDFGGADDDDDSAAGPLHHYLAEWLGPQGVPTRQEVGDYFRHRQQYRPRFNGLT